VGTASPTSYTNLKTLAISGTNGGVVDINPSGGTAAGGLQLIARATDTTFVANGPSGGSSAYMAFSTGTTGASTERMRIDSDGGVRINSTGIVYATGELLSVNTGTGNTGVAFAGTNSRVVGIWNKGTSSPEFVQFAQGASGLPCGSINFNGSLTLYNQTSDYRLKTVIAPITDAGTRIDAIKPIEYDWKENGKRTKGFLAHEFAEVYPNTVSGEKDAVDADGKPVYQSMQASSAEVMADLISEIQSLRKRIATLEAK
jgi:hypothetical protein